MTDRVDFSAVRLPDGVAGENPYDSAEKFLDALSPRSVVWGEDPAGWIYRGQANADWGLTARALRDPPPFEKFGIFGDTSDPMSRLRLEREVINRFNEGLDENGLHVPADLAARGLAQHHGLPTLLLDWTRRAPIAAYFAAVQAADKETPGLRTHLAVWALYAPRQWRMRAGFELPVYQPPAATNPNLHAQAGLFTMPSQLGEDYPSLEQHLYRLRRATGQTFPLLRLTLPIAEASKLLRLLSYEGINGASMFPGADGVVRAMRECALWDKRN